jgi:TPR repeat protein
MGTHGTRNSRTPRGGMWVAVLEAMNTRLAASLAMLFCGAIVLVACGDPGDETPSPRSPANESGWSGASSGATATVRPDDAKAAATACAVGDIDGCKSKCSAGDGASCNRLGITYERAGNARDLERARKSFHRACAAKSKEGCDSERRLLVADAKRMEAAARSYKTCQEGSLRECQDACDGGDGIACEQIGMVYVVGKRVARDRAKAEAAFQKACDAGNAGMVGGGCEWLGTLYKPQGCPPGRTCMQIGGFGGPVDAQKAAGYFWKACDAGGAAGCKQIVEMMQEQTFTPRPADMTALLATLEEGCDGADERIPDDACEGMLAIVDDHLFTADTRGEVVKQLGALCDAGRAEFCGRKKDLADAP